MALVMDGKTAHLPVATRPHEESNRVLEDLNQRGKILGRAAH